MSLILLLLVYWRNTAFVTELQEPAFSTQKDYHHRKRIILLTVLNNNLFIQDVEKSIKIIVSFQRTSQNIIFHVETFPFCIVPLCLILLFKFL